MTVLPINIGDVRGARFETESGGLLNFVFHENANQYTFSWSTNLSAFECFELLDKYQTLQPPIERQETLPFAVGVENSNGEWATDFNPASKPPYEDIFQAILSRVPEEYQVCARCELPDIAWVWLANSPLQSGSDVRTFGLVAKFLDVPFVVTAFDLTAGEYLKPLRDRFVALVGAAPDQEKIASVLSHS